MSVSVAIVAFDSGYSYNGKYRKKEKFNKKVIFYQKQLLA